MERGQDKRKVYTFVQETGVLVVDCCECKRNLFCQYRSPMEKSCAFAEYRICTGKRLRRGDMGCADGILGDGLVPMSWLEYKRELTRKVWERQIKRAPLSVKADMRGWMQEELAKLDHAIEIDRLHREGVL